MEKINFVNNQAPALNATNLNQMQTNIDNAKADNLVVEDSKLSLMANGEKIGDEIQLPSQINVNNASSTSQNDTYSCEYINDIDDKLNKTNAQSLEFGFDDGFNLIINLGDGTKARLQWNNDNIMFKYYDGSSWVTRWTK